MLVTFIIYIDIFVSANMQVLVLAFLPGQASAANMTNFELLDLLYCRNIVEDIWPELHEFGHSGLIQAFPIIFDVIGVSRKI